MIKLILIFHQPPSGSKVYPPLSFWSLNHKLDNFWNLTPQPFRLDRTDKGEAIMLYVREKISIKTNRTRLSWSILLVEINLRKKKWLLVCNYNPHKTLVPDCLECISKEMDSLSTKYDNVFPWGDFNSETLKKLWQRFAKNV